MELLEVFYRRKLRKKQRKAELGRSEGALCRAPSEASVNNLATGLISKVLRLTTRRSEPASRPHSWHSTKLGEGQQDSRLMELSDRATGSMGGAWHQHSYHTSASTTDLSAGFDSGYLRKSPDQYSSRGSMESLDPPQPSHHHPGSQHHHHIHGGSHPTYSSCHQLSSARSSNSIDHIHSKRDSAYSSFSTSSSIPEYLASTNYFSPERSYSLETVPQRGGSGDIQQADIHYVRTVYDTQQRCPPEHEISATSAELLRNNNKALSGGVARTGQGQDQRGSAGRVYHRGSSSCSSSSSGSSSGGVPASNRHSVGQLWGQAASHSSYESLRGVPAPPQRSDSYAAIRNHERHERPNSWSSLEHARSLRSLHKGSWHHSSGSVASAKGCYGAEGQLHTVVEKSPESSPTTKPRQGGGFPQPSSSPVPSSGSPGSPQLAPLILPTGLYQVPQPEPHYAQTPSSSPSPGSPRVNQALAKESSQQQHQASPGAGGSNRRETEGWRDGRMSAVENGYLNNPSASMLSQSSASSSMSPPSTQLRNQLQEVHRPHQEDVTFGLPLKAVGGGAGSQDGFQPSQIHQESHSQSFPEPQTYANQEPQNQIIEERNRGHQVSQPQLPHSFRPPSSQSTSQEWRDQFRTVDQPSFQPEAVASAKVAQGQVPASPPVQPLIHPPVPTTTTNPQPSSCLHSDSAALQYNEQRDHRDKDDARDNPLTRLESALAEVQQCASPESVVSAKSSQGYSSYGDSGHGPTRSLSVLEKVNRFERRERAGKQRSRSTSHSYNKNQQNEKGRSSPCGTEDLRNMLERSTNLTKAQRTLSYRGGNIVLSQPRTADPNSALQRSRSTIQLDMLPREEDYRWRQDLQELLGPIQDVSFNRTYRESLKDAQSKVLNSTSFQRRDLSASINSPPRAAPSSFPNAQQEKKGPKTMPKPQAVFITQPQVTSLHTPKERHMVSPEARGQSPPALPSVPPVGPAPPTRICGRKRLTTDQKKHSYSEPEKMNEIGLLDPETASLFRRGGETSVADRRRMFELAAGRLGGGASRNAVSRPDLRQLQHDALAEYVERKRGRKKEEEGQGRAERPRSSYIQPDNNNHTDTLSLSSASSMLSLDDSGQNRSFFPGERHLSSTLPLGCNPQILQSGLLYPKRAMAQRPLASHPPSFPSGSHPDLCAQGKQFPLDLSPESGPHGHGQVVHGSPDLNQYFQASVPQQSNRLSTQLNGALQRAGSDRSAGKSASAEDLLEISEERPVTLQHHRSRSNPTEERLSQDMTPDDVRMFGVFIVETGGCALAADRPTDIRGSEGSASPQQDQISQNAVQPTQTPQGCTPVSRRDRQRNGDRQRTHSTSTLAASVGLPCPFSPPGASSSSEWHSSERLSQANLDAITFPGVSSDSNVETEQEDRGLGRHRDTSVSGNTAKELGRERTSSLEMRGGSSAEDTRSASSTTPSPLPHTQPEPTANRKDTSVLQHLSTLHISESSLSGPLSSSQLLEPSASLLQEDYDEVFLQNPVPPSPPPPIRETHIVEDSYLPPPPPELEQEAGQQTVESPQPMNSSIIPAGRSPLQSLSLIPHPVSQPSASLEPQPSATSSSGPNTDDCLGLPLPRRERTSEELRVEELVRQLVLQDRSSAPLLNLWGETTTVELMEEIFSNTKGVGKLAWQRRGSSRLDNSIHDDADQGKETDVDEEEKDHSMRKVELCDALRQSVSTLRQEKETLCEEQRRHRALGATVEALVQERCKPNEREKYSIFIGELEKIVNLLLILCGCLSRVDKSLHSLEREDLTAEDTAVERDSLHVKRSQILSQTEEAWELKKNLDQRQRVVHTILSGYLTQPQLCDYHHFISTKPSLLLRQRHLDDLIRQGEDQLTRLEESLPPEQEGAGGWSSASPFLSPSPAPFTSAAVIPGSAHSVPRSTAVTSL
ncbi:protein Shroom3 isoform X2 [Genypterus blacodes]|uniref:protein Shroom3 isoform X2 n=1 Tax=Genypterus blacodes TaxID=154954 RepID=UPI003F767803